MKVYRIGFFFILVGVAFIYNFSHNRLIIEADKMLDYAFITESPTGNKIVGFIEDCSGQMTKTTSTTSGLCVRMVYFYNLYEGTRGKCFLNGGFAQGVRMFEDMEVKWINENSLEWKSSWSNGKNIVQSFDSGNCDDYSGVMSRFELMPTLEGTKKRYASQANEIAKRQNEKLMKEAMQIIQSK